MRITALSILLFAAPALAEETAESSIKYRQTVMYAMGNNMGMSKLLVKGQVADRPGDLVAVAESLHALGVNLEKSFPKGSGPESKLETEALDTIWTDAAGFTAAVKAYNDATAAFVEAAKSGDMAKAAEARGAVGQSCGGCHETFRKDEH